MSLRYLDNSRRNIGLSYFETHKRLIVRREENIALLLSNLHQNFEHLAFAERNKNTKQENNVECGRESGTFRGKVSLFSIYSVSSLFA